MSAGGGRPVSIAGEHNEVALRDAQADRDHVKPRLRMLGLEAKQVTVPYVVSQPARPPSKVRLSLNTSYSPPLRLATARAVFLRMAFEAL